MQRKLVVFIAGNMLMLLSAPVQVQGTKELPKVYTMNTCLGPLMRDPKAQPVMGAFMEKMMPGMDMEIIENPQNDSMDMSGEMIKSVIENMPIRQLLSYIPGLSRDMLEKMLDMLNSQR